MVLSLGVRYCEIRSYANVLESLLFNECNILRTEMQPESRKLFEIYILEDVIQNACGFHRETSNVPRRGASRRGVGVRVDLTYR